HKRKDVFAQIDVKVALKATGDLHVGYVKKLLVGSAGKSNSQGLADAAMGAIAATNVFGLRLFRASVVQNGGEHPVCILSESREPGTPFDVASRLVQLADQEAFVVVLGIRQRKRIRAEALAQIPEADRNHLTAGTILTAFSQVSPVGRDALADHLIGET